MVYFDNQIFQRVICYSVFIEAWSVRTPGNKFIPGRFLDAFGFKQTFAQLGLPSNGFRRGVVRTSCITTCIFELRLILISLYIGHPTRLAYTVISGVQRLFSFQIL